MAKIFRGLLLLIMMILSLNSCAPQEKNIYLDTLPGYVVIKKSELVELMNNCTECKQELTNCINSKEKE